MQEDGMNIFNIHPINYLKKNARDVLTRSQETRDPVAMTVNGKVAAIIQDALSYQKMQAQLAMPRILAHGREQVEDGKLTEHDDYSD